MSVFAGTGLHLPRASRVWRNVGEQFRSSASAWCSLPALMSLALLLGCSSANLPALMASTLSTACDWGQTRSAASAGWVNKEEGNMILGKEPSVGSVDSYFVTAALFNLALYLMMPPRMKWAIPAAVTAFQSRTIAGNTATVPAPWCGL